MQNFPYVQSKKWKMTHQKIGADNSYKVPGYNLPVLSQQKKNTTKRCEISWKLTIKSLWTYFTPFSSGAIVDFVQVNVSWVTPEESKKAFLKAGIFWCPCKNKQLPQRNDIEFD